MRRGRRPPRPRKWTMKIIGSAKYLHNDRIEILLNFRKEYRQKLQVSRLHADQFARAEALRAAWEATNLAFWIVVVIGRRILFWI
jgi:hypothetical protein